MRLARFAVVLDVCCVLIFVVIGRASHTKGESLAGIASTSWPFLCGLAVAWAASRGCRLSLARALSPACPPPAGAYPAACCPAGARAHPRQGQDGSASR